MVKLNDVKMCRSLLPGPGSSCSYIFMRLSTLVLPLKPRLTSVIDLQGVVHKSKFCELPVNVFIVIIMQGVRNFSCVEGVVFLFHFRAIQVLRNTFVWKFDTYPNNVEPRTFVKFFLEILHTPPPLPYVTLDE